MVAVFYYKKNFEGGMDFMAISIDGFYVTSLDMMTLFDNANNLEAMLDELQDATIENTQENNDITGKNGAVIGTLKRNKAVNVTANSGLIVAGALAAQTGSEVEEGTFVVRATEILTVNSNSATLEGTPVGAEGAEIVTLRKKSASGMLTGTYEQDATASATGKFSYADGTITFFTGDFNDGDQVVVFYDMEVENAVKVSNDANTYSRTCRCYIDCQVQDRCDNIYHGQIYIPRFDCDGNVTINLGGTDNVMSITGRSLKSLCSVGADAGKFWDFIFWE